MKKKQFDVWQQEHQSQSELISAEEVKFTGGCLIFLVNEKVVKAYAPGAWWECTER